MTVFYAFANRQEISVIYAWLIARNFFISSGTLGFLYFHHWCSKRALPISKSAENNSLSFGAAKRRAKRGVERGGWQCLIPFIRSALSQSQKTRRIKGTVIRSCKATRRARSGARRMTVPFSHCSSKRALPISKSAENNSDCHSELHSDARGVVRGGWQCITFIRSALSQSRKARRIIVTVIRSCKATHRARSGARRMTVHNCIPVSCLIFR
jgi:hypothetical protein